MTDSPTDWGPIPLFMPPNYRCFVTLRCTILITGLPFSSTREGEWQIHAMAEIWRPRAKTRPALESCTEEAEGSPVHFINARNQYVRHKISSPARRRFHSRSIANELS